VRCTSNSGNPRPMQPMSSHPALRAHSLPDIRRTFAVLAPNKSEFQPLRVHIIRKCLMSGNLWFDCRFPCASRTPSHVSSISRRRSRRRACRSTPSHRPSSDGLTSILPANNAAVQPSAASSPGRYPALSSEQEDQCSSQSEYRPPQFPPSRSPGGVRAPGHAIRHSPDHR